MSRPQCIQPAVKGAHLLKATDSVSDDVDLAVS